MQITHLIVVGIVLLGMSFLIGSAFGQAGAFSAAQPNHPLQQIRTIPNGGSVDADGDGVIDQAGEISVTTTTTNFDSSVTVDCQGTSKAIMGGCDCGGKPITQNIPTLSGSNPKGWACACESGISGQLILACMG